MPLQSLPFHAVWGAFYKKVIRRKFVQDVGVLTVGNVVKAVLTIGQGIIVARLLGPELYGVSALAMSYPSLVNTLFDARSWEASLKYMAEFQTRNEQERVLAMCKLGYALDGAIAASGFLVVLVTAHWAAYHITHRPETVWLIVLYSAALVPGALEGNSYAVLAHLGRFPTIAWIGILATALRAALVLGLVLLGWQVTGVVLGNAIAVAMTGLIYGGIAHRILRRGCRASWLQASWQALKGRRREIFAFLLYNDLNAIINMVSRYADVVLVGYFRDATEAGYYRLAKSVSGAMGHVVGPLESVTYPGLARQWSRGEVSVFWYRVKRLTWQIGVPLGLLSLLGLLLVRPAITLLVGQAYLPAVFATQLSLALASWQGMFFWLRPTYLAIGKIRVFVMASTVFAGALFCAWIVVTPRFGYMGIIVVALLLGIMKDLSCALLLSWQRA